MSVTQYNVYQQLKSVNGFGLPLSNTTYSATLAADVEQNLAFPAGAADGVGAQIKNKYVCIINITFPVWLAVNETAAAAAGATFAATTSALLTNNETCFYGKTGDILHFISDTADNSISVRFYAIQE